MSSLAFILYPYSFNTNTSITVTWLFIGRIFQSAASNALWIVGLSTLADNIGSEHIGKISGVISTMAAAGTSAGPVVSGILFELGGYWASWAGVFALIFVDIVMRILMVEKPMAREKRNKCKSDPFSFFHFATTGLKLTIIVSKAAIPTAPEIAPVDPEQAPLLPAPESRETPLRVTEIGGWRFYARVFRHRGFFAGVTSFFCFSLLVASFSTTLPLYVQNVFKFDTFKTGLLFAALEGPGMILSPIFGWLKDRYGSRWPTTVGFLSTVPFFWLLGVPGDKGFEWANVGTRGQTIYIFCMVMIGCLLCLLNGLGMMEVTCKFVPFPMFSPF